MSRERVIVLGAGIQGVCAALALQNHGWSVTLIDEAPDCMLRSSLRNEGKIHLGFVYANDSSFKTSLLMLRAGLRFTNLIEGWIGEHVAWHLLKSRPFTFLVSRGSLLSPEKILSSYERLQNAYRESFASERSNYLGDTLVELWREIPLHSLSNLIRADSSLKAIETVEASIDLVRFRELMRSSLIASSKVETLYGHQVEFVTRTSDGFRVEGVNSERSKWDRSAEIVVNCLWEGRLKIDQLLGITPARKWVYRLKHRLLGELPRSLSALPSLTLVLGPFGDIVVNPSRRTYVSWYPACMQGWSTDLSPPKVWDKACKGESTGQRAEVISQEALSAFDEFVPGMLNFEVDEVDAGVIFSWGESDIDDPESELHRRHEIGIHCHDGYFSIDTGKFTCAPLFAEQLVSKIR